MKKSIKNKVLVSRLKQLVDDVELARKKRGWTQEELASRAEISVASYKNFISQKSSPSLNLVLRVLWVLELADGVLETARPEKDTIGLSLDRRKLNGATKRENKPDESKLDF